MVRNVLVTGAAGYIGGSVLEDFTTQTSGPLTDVNIIGAVRSTEQIPAVSKTGAKVVLVDLDNKNAVEEAVLRNEVDMIVHTASSSHPSLASNLVGALGQRRKLTGHDVYFIHSSITTLFSEEAGWSYGEIKDTDDVFAKEKQIGGPHPVRETTITVIDEAKEQGVVALNVVVPQICKGTGQWRKLSVSIPAFIRASIAKKTAYKFDKEGKPPATHIDDLVALYTLLTQRILRGEPVPTGEKGYYFATVHRSPWWAVMDELARILHARGLVGSPDAEIWPSYEEAAQVLGFPPQHIHAMVTSVGQPVAVNAYRLGWKPQWDEERFMNSLEDEVQDVLDFDTIKPSLFNSIPK